MKILETFVSFTGEIDVGKFAFFIKMNKGGVDVDINKLVSQAIHFPYIVLLGEPFIYKDDVGKFVKKCKKQNSKIIFMIYTKGTIRPVGIGQFDDIKYIVNLQLDKNVKYEYRINPDVINWFNQLNANFKFDVENEDDIDDAELIIQDLGLIKKNIYLSRKKISEEFLETLIKYCKTKGYNFSVNFREMFWKNDGRK